MQHAAFLRGINLGAHNRMSMDALRKIFEECGATAVRSYLQSGNIVYRAPQGIAEPITLAIHKQFRLTIPVVTRTAGELQEVVRANPFPDQELCVMFLRDVPNLAALTALDPSRSHPDEYIVHGRDIYMRLLTGPRTKLTNNYFDRQLNTVSTVRNWRTVNAVLELATS